MPRHAPDPPSSIPPEDQLHVRLRRAREEAGMSMREAGERFGNRTSSWVGEVEKGIVRFYPRRLDDYAAVFGLRVELVPIADAEVTVPPAVAIPPASPSMCEVCGFSPAAQAFVLSGPYVQRYTGLVCVPCGDRSEALTASGYRVLRFALTPTGGA